MSCFKIIIIIIIIIIKVWYSTYIFVAVLCTEEHLDPGYWLTANHKLHFIWIQKHIFKHRVVAVPEPRSVH
jgi:hypothetical protein